ncbi:tyrosine--tRNA ligase [Nannocystaceae bacterium ST9]
MPEHPNPSSAALRALAERGLIEQVSDFAGLDAALAAGMVTFYIGYDPTAPSLHVGNLVTIMGMRRLQQQGHRPIVVLGSGTARIGDPTGRSDTRRLLDAEQIAVHVAAIRKQFGRLIHFDTGKPNDALFFDNYEWLAGLGYIDFLRDIGRHFTVNRMIAAKTYRDRLEAELPLSFLEFNYQLVQAYDFHHLYNRHGCTMQAGGGDQWGNMIAGVELIRRIRADMRRGDEAEQEPDQVHCLTFPLLTTADGSKMGKTAKGAVWLDPEQVSPFDYYQFWINCHDDDVGKALRTFTDVPVEQIAELTGKRGRELNEAKALLALEATRILHGDEAAEQAKRGAAQAFGRSEDWSALPLVELPLASISLLDLVVHDQIGGFKSKRDARERIKSGAVKLDGEPATDPAEAIDPGRCGPEGLRLQVGPKKRLRVRLTGA